MAKLPLPSLGCGLMFMFATAADALAGCELTAAPLLTKRHCAVYVLAFQDAASLFVKKLRPLMFCCATQTNAA